MITQKTLMHVFITATLSIGAALSAHAANLSVTVENVANNKGKVLISLCDKQSFLKKCAQSRMLSANDKGVLTFEFKDIAVGDYALMGFHDENNNMKFDKDANGMPQEGWGFSRNARGKFGAPTFEDAAISVKIGDNKTAISLFY